MICPKCKENKAHRSRRSGFKDLGARLFFRTPYRCRACKERFYVNLRGSSVLELRSTEEKRVIKLRRGLRMQHIKRQALSYGIGTLILVIILYFMFQQRIPTE
jgi:hypothetical protein